MKSIKFLIALIAIISMNVLAIPPDTVPAPARDVTVVNTPLPITGEIDADVTIINDASSPVPVTGEVEITGTPSVRIIDGRMPFQATLQCFEPSCGDQVIYTVPPDQMCVVEYFSCITNVTDASTPAALICQINTVVDGDSVQHNLNVTPFITTAHPLTSGKYLSAGEMVKLYASPGSSIKVDGFLTSTVATFPDLWVSISGYCIDVDAP